MKVIIATQAYNAEEYLAETVESVLKQTYTNFTYLLIDSASTDSTSQIMQEYSKKDSRIKYIHFDVNALGRCEQCAAKEDGDYYMALDSDDLLEPYSLEKMVSIAKEYQVDIVVGGSIWFDDKTKSCIGERKPEYSFVINKENYASLYPYYHKFFRTIWGKLYRMDVVKSVDVDKIANSSLVYGKDTWFAFQALRKARNIYSYDSSIHRYRIRQSSISHQYKSVQHDSDIFLYNDAVDFLESFGEISSENMDFIYTVYLNACKDTLINLLKSNLTSDEKISECLRVLSNEVTQKSLLKNLREVNELKEVVRAVLNQNATKVTVKSQNVLTTLINEFLVNCKNLFSIELMPLLVIVPKIWDSFIRDEKEELLENVLVLISENIELSKSFELAVFVKKIIPDNTPVSNIKNEAFFYNYPEICKMVLALENSEVLEKMTEIFFSGNEINCPEDFLNLYVTLAALENQVEAFLFGNIQKAYLFIDEKRFDEATQIVNDLIEMGLTDNDDIVELQKLLGD